MKSNRLYTDRSHTNRDTNVSRQLKSQSPSIGQRLIPSIKIPPYGSATSSVRKASKYCFISPAIRAALLSIAGPDGILATRKGKYWEDTVALHLYREFSSKRVGNVVYDPSAASADFVLQMTTGQEIAIEVGAGQKGISQVLNTMKQRKIEKGLVISASDLALSEDKRVLMIPFRYFLLM